MTRIYRYSAICLLLLVATECNLVPAYGEWQIIRESQIDLPVDYVRFFDDDNGVAFGRKSMLVTDDGGQTWINRTNERIDKYLFGTFISHEVGVFYQKGFDRLGRELYHTQDSGRNWESFRTQLDVPYTFSTMAIHSAEAMVFTSPEEGWTIGERWDDSPQHCVLHTSDGGRSWEVQLEKNVDDKLFWLYSVSFLNSQQGWGYGKVIKADGSLLNLIVGTTDGGETWFRSEFIDPSYFVLGWGIYEVTFTTPEIGWACGDAVFYTEDGGHTWELKFREWGCTAFFLDEKTGWLLQPKVLLHTTDGGETWREMPFRQPFSRPNWGIYFINEDEGWIAGNGGLIHTQDGGKTWEQHITMYPDLRAVDFISPESGIAVGKEVLVTEDGLEWQSENWTGKFSGAPYLAEVDFVDEQTGWICEPGVLWQTRNSGRTWNRIAGIQFRDTCFINPQQGWGVIDDNNADIYSTSDGGETWRLIHHNAMTDKHASVYFLDEQNGWATTFVSGDIYRTENGGKAWEKLGPLPESPIYLSKICFVDEDMGWVLDADKIYCTEDSGRNWHLDAEFPGKTLNDICYDRGKSLYVVGNAGTILRYTDPRLSREYAVEAGDRLATQWGEQKSSHNAGRDGLPDRTELCQNYPNPFNPDTWIPYRLAEDGKMTITIYDSGCRIVRVLDLGHRKPGYHTVHWDGKDDSGQSLASGIYFYALKTNDGFSNSRKMILLR